MTKTLVVATEDGAEHRYPNHHAYYHDDTQYLSIIPDKEGTQLKDKTALYRNWTSWRIEEDTTTKHA
jgi:hypothetical protein